MTDAEHAELSRQVALAIGYAPESVRVVTRWVSDKHDICEIYRTHRYAAPNGPDSWHPFDYRDPTVALPLLKWLCESYDGDVMYVRRKWHASSIAVDPIQVIEVADTLEEAIARAVLAVKGGV